jgi:photosystem II PsbY protein
MRDFIKKLKARMINSMDMRLLIVLLPLLLAAGWALKNILPYATRQIQAFLNK